VRQTILVTRTIPIAIVSLMRWGNHSATARIRLADQHLDCVTKAKIAGKIVTKGLEDAIGAARAPAAELEGEEMVAVHTLVAKIFIAVPNLDLNCLTKAKNAGGSVTGLENAIGAARAPAAEKDG